MQMLTWANGAQVSIALRRKALDNYVNHNLKIKSFNANQISFQSLCALHESTWANSD